MSENGVLFFRMFEKIGNIKKSDGTMNVQLVCGEQIFDCLEKSSEPKRYAI